MEALTPSLTIAGMLARWPATAAVLVAHRMACVGCEMNGFDTLAEAAVAYGLPLDRLLADLRGAIDERR